MRPVCLTVDRFPSCITNPTLGPWCNTTLSPTNRAAALVAAMTLEEKAANMDSHNFGVPSKGAPPNLFSESLHGICAGCGAPFQFPRYMSTGCPTAFPQVTPAFINRSLPL